MVVAIIIELNAKSGIAVTQNMFKQHFTFDIATKISGCKFKHLVVGDRIIIKGHNNLNGITNIELVDIVSKWDKILSKDKKYSIKDTKTTKKNFHIINPDVTNYDARYARFDLGSLIKHLYKYESTMRVRDWTILKYFSDGKSVREISRLSNISKSSVYRVIKKYEYLYMKGK